MRTVLGFIEKSGFPVLHPQSDAWLSAGEASRYRGLTFARRQESYLLGRLSAKRALGRAFGEANLRRIDIPSGVFDQPLVLYPTREPHEVSLTHNDWGALAIAFPSGHPMGLDLETPAPERLGTILAQLTPSERQWVEPQPLWLATLAWTAREALSKALRCGLMVSMEVLEVTSPTLLEPGVWQGRFRHFAQYQFTAWRRAGGILALVHPRHSRLTGSPKGLAAMLEPVPRG